MKPPEPLLRVSLEWDDDRLRVEKVERVDGLVELTRGGNLTSSQWAREHFEGCYDEIERLLEDAFHEEPCPGVFHGDVGRLVVTGKMWDSFDAFTGEADAGFTLEDVEQLLTRAQIGAAT